MKKPRVDYNAREYQDLITNHILDHPRSAVWASMGMGKTVSTATALSALSMVESGPMLVLAPLRVAKSTWPEEFSKWSHLAGMQLVPIVGTETARRAALRFDVPVFSINYENIPWLVEHYGERWPFRIVVSDESTKLKSYRGSIQRSKLGNEFIRGGGGQRARALGSIAHTKIKRFVELSGTPAPNGLVDLWGQMWFLDGGQRLGRTFEGFKQRWFRPAFDGYGLDPLPDAQAEIQERLHDVCLTVDAKDYFDLQEPIVSNRVVQIGGNAMSSYRKMEKEMYAEFEGGRSVEAFNAAAKSQKLLQIASGAVYLDPEADSDFHPKSKEWKEVHDMKVQALEEIIEEAGGAPVLVAYHFRSDLTRLLHAFPKARHLDSNPQTQVDWNAGKIPILLAHPASAGHGLNLQEGGNILVYFSHDWNLENRLQILERIGPVRQKQAGYDRPVFVYNIIAEGTVDELVLERIETKDEVQTILLRAMKRERDKPKFV